MTERVNSPRVIGLEVSEAEALLEASGFKVIKNLVSCRKGASGESARVIRQRDTDIATVTLDYSLFKTLINE